MSTLTRRQRHDERVARQRRESRARKVVIRFLHQHGSAAWSQKDQRRLAAVAMLTSVLYSDLPAAAEALLAAFPDLGSKEPAQPSKIKLERQQGPSQSQINAFYDSWEWKRLSYQAKLELGRRCACCGATPDDGATMNTDHVKPIRKYWHLRLDPTNLQILCSGCNQGKGSWDETDFRATHHDYLTEEYRAVVGPPSTLN